jgi:geranylgeranyl pyrophosphate synthase
MSLQQIYKPISNELEKVEELIKTQLASVLNDRKSRGINDEFIREVISHLFKKPGKRLRPALVLLSARLVGSPEVQKPETLVQMAAAVELIHSASLIHDDIIDDSQERRKTPTLNKQFDNTVAVLTGDILYAQFFSLLTNLPGVSNALKLSLFDLFSNLTRNMCLGEIFQHQIVNHYFEPNFKEYLKVLENKTALLMSACCKCGALLNGSSEQEADFMEDFGLHFGLAYQLVDDHIDKDSPLTGEVDLVKQAEQHIIKAKEALFSVSVNGAGKHLDSLCDFVLARAGNPARIAVNNG